MPSLTLSRKRSFPTKSLISGELFNKRMEGLTPHTAQVKKYFRWISQGTYNKSGVLIQDASKWPQSMA